MLAALSISTRPIIRSRERSANAYLSSTPRLDSETVMLNMMSPASVAVYFANGHAATGNWFTGSKPDCRACSSNSSTAVSRCEASNSKNVVKRAGSERKLLLGAGAPALSTTESGNGTGYKRLVATGFTGQFDRIELANRQYPTKCVGTTLGAFTLESGTASTVSSGVNLPSFYGVDVSSQSGFSKNTKVDFKFTAKGKFLCGTNNTPEANYPGVIMADWKRR